MVADPSMNWISNADVSRLKKRNFKQLLKKLRLLLSKRRIKFSGLNLNLAKLDKRLTERFKRKRRSLTIHARTINELWTPCKLLLRLNVVLKLRPFVLRRNLSLILMNSKLLLTMPTKQILRHISQLRGTKDSLGM